MDKKKFNDRKELRTFGIGLGVILSLIATGQLITGGEIYPYFYGAGIIIFLIGIILPILLKPVYIVFSYISLVIGWVVTRVILSVLFYLVFTPTGLLLKLFGKKLLEMRTEKNTDSYWKDKILLKTEKNRYENQF